MKHKVVILVVFTLTLITGQLACNAQTTSLESVLRNNLSGIGISYSNLGHPSFNKPEYINSAKIENNKLILKYSLKDYPNRYANKKELVQYTCTVNLNSLTMIEKCEMQVTKDNEFTYGISIQTSEPIITSSNYNFSQSFPPLILYFSCRSTYIQNELYSVLKNTLSPYLPSVPHDETELRNCLSELNKLFSSYKINSEDAIHFQIETKQKHISFQGEYLVISFTDPCNECWSSTGKKPGKKELRIPIHDAKFSSSLIIKSESGIEYSVNGTKSIIKQYYFHADALVQNKMVRLLLAFQQGVIELNFSGNIGTGNNKTDQNRPVQQKKISNTFGQ